MTSAQPSQPSSARQQISRALMWMNSTSPFFSVLSRFATFVESEAIPTASTDGRRILYNPTFIEGLKRTEVQAVVLHEVLHAALLHAIRRGTREPVRWNIAADVVVNGIICQQKGVDLTAGAIRAQHLEHLRVEEIYELLEREESLCKATPQCLADHDHGDEGGSNEARRLLELEEYWRRALRQAEAVARSTQQGNLPAGLDRLLRGLGQSEIDWRAQLWRFLVRTPADFGGIDRRFIYQKLYLETLDSETVKVFVAIDTSGSIAGTQLDAFIGEVRGILRAYPHLEGELYYADADLYGPFSVHDEADRPQPKGGGGTSFVPFFNHIDKLAIEGDAVCIYLTDGYGTFPASSALPTLWVVTPGGLDDGKFPFGEVVRLINATLAAMAGEQELEQLRARVRELEASERRLTEQNAQLDRALREHLGELSRSEARFRQLIERLPMLVAIHRGGLFTYVNASGAASLGYSPEQLIGTPILSIVHPDDHEMIKERVRRMLAEGTHAPFREERLLRSDGSFLLAEVGAFFLPIDGLPSVVVFATDVTERRQLEEHLRRSARMEAVGRLAGGIAHDFNNLLFIILNSLHFVQRRLAPDDPNRHDIDQIHATARRAAELTRQLLTFSRGAEPAAEVIDVNRVLRDIERLLLGTLGEAVELHMTLDRRPCRIKIARANLEQVLVNLAVNARDAMPEGGTLSIDSSLVEVEHGPSAQRADPPPGLYVCITVSDSGVGMTREVASHAFEPFFTTKEHGKGTGLGLSIVYGILRKAGGTVTLDSAPGAGTTFTIWLPALDEPSTPSIPMMLVPQPRGSGEVVLVVEDEEGVRSMVERILSENSYQVLSAASPVDALLLLERHAGIIHLLLTDVIMPRMSGPELAQRARALRPDLRVLFMSGYTGNELTRHGIEDADAHLLRKPFSVAELLRRLRVELSK